MKITRIDLAGRDKKGASIFAVLTRKRGSEYIEVEILSPADTRQHKVLADNEKDQFSMAQCFRDQLRRLPRHQFDDP